MKILRWILVLCGLALFAYSFTLPAVREASAAPGKAGFEGYKCASIALVNTWGSEGLKLMHNEPADFFSLLISGWINLIFPLVLIFTLIRPHGAASSVLCLLVVLMFAACWVFFLRHHLNALVGYYAWMGGVILALGAARFRPQS
ncbi:MAG TPA: hypothetical protein VE783_12650 [Candidatus Limnocylindrales bacterium]|nr:hypothetical protein [Candidatus Limnocylindrales bacterium]